MRLRLFTSGILLILLPASLAEAEDFYFDSAGTRIHYIVEGKGEPVVLIHGFAQDIALGWVETGVVKGLSENYRVIAIDVRGHGRSDKPHAPARYGSAMAEDVVRLLDHLNIQRTHLVGYSMGGRIALMLLAQKPERIRTAVIGGHGWMDAEGLRVRQAMLQQTAQSLENGKGAAPMIVSLTPPGAEPPTPNQIDAANDFYGSRNDPLALAAVLRSLAGPQPPELKLRANKGPTLALVGELDPRRPDVERLAGIAPSLKLVIISGTHHLDTVRNPAFLENVRAFLAADAE